MLEDLARNSLSFWLGDQISLGGYIFDAYLRMSHDRGLTITQHPVETGAPIADHAYLDPLVFELEIGMTDTTLGKKPSQFSGLNILYTNKDNPSRSVKAYEVLVQMQASKQEYTFICRYGEFDVVVEKITPEDDYTTKYALKARVTLRQIIKTSTETVKVSGDPQITDKVSRGAQNSQPAGLGEDSGLYNILGVNIGR